MSSEIEQLKSEVRVLDQEWRSISMMLKSKEAASAKTMKPWQTILAIFVTACVAILATNYFITWTWKREAIRTGHAQYDPRTGVWQWKGRR